MLEIIGTVSARGPGPVERVIWGCCVLLKLDKRHSDWDGIWFLFARPVLNQNSSAAPYISFDCGETRKENSILIRECLYGSSEIRHILV